MTDNIMDSGYRRWACPAPKAVFLLVHGLGANTGRWEALAEFFMKRGVASYAVELKRTDTFREYFEEMSRLYKIAANENPSRKIFLVGESMGALISFLFLSSHPGLFSGLICLSPAFANRIRLSALAHLKIALALIYDRRKMLTVPFDSSMLTRDLEYRQKMDADPGEHRAASAKLLAQILLYQLRARFCRNPGTGSVLFLVAGYDVIIDNSAARTIFDRLKIEDKKILEFPEMHHALSIDTGKEAVFEAMYAWLEERI